MTDVGRGTAPTHPSDAAGPSLAGVLLAVVVGALLVVLDLDVDGIPLLPDPIGWSIVAIGAVRLRAPQLREGGHRAPARRRVGGALLVLAVVSAIDGVLELSGVRAPAEVASRPWALWDAALLVATVVVVVAFLRTVAAWAADRPSPRAAARLRRSSLLLGVAWGAVAVALLVAAAVLDTGDVAADLGGGAGLVLAVGVLAMFGVLAHAGWALLRLRGELLRDPAGAGSDPVAGGGTTDGPDDGDR